LSAIVTARLVVHPAITNHRKRGDGHKYQPASPDPADHGELHELADDRERGELVLGGGRHRQEGHGGQREQRAEPTKDSR
jgi:hypothetical protein